MTPASDLHGASHALSTASFDWSATDLGAPAQWPASLTLTVDLMLNSPAAALLMWGPAQVMVYNHAYTDLLGATHLQVPGGRVPTLAPAAWLVHPAALAAAWQGVATVCPDQALPVRHDGVSSDLLVDLFWTPVRIADGTVGGVLCTLAPAARAPLHIEADARPLHILVVEDNPDAQYLVCEMLRAFGHEVDAALDGETALPLLATTPFDVLFTDVSLPGMSGVDLARTALRGQPRLKVVFASGFGDTLTRHVEFAATSLTKPYDLEALQQTLADIGRQLQADGV